MGVDKVPIPRSNREIAAKAKKEKRYTTRKKFFLGGEKIREVWRSALPSPRKKGKNFMVNSEAAASLLCLVCVRRRRGAAKQPSPSFPSPHNLAREGGGVGSQKAPSDSFLLLSLSTLTAAHCRGDPKWSG